jgi:uncharacterized membrane protein YjjB (DUF3815 family)
MIMAMVGVITGLMFSIVFSSSKDLIALIPLLGAVGGLVGYLIDKKKAKSDD